MSDERQTGPRPRFVWSNLFLVVLLAAAMVAVYLYQPWHERPPKPTPVGTSPPAQAK